MNVGFATFGQLMEKIYLNKWYPVETSNGKFNFVQVDHTWDAYPNGTKTVFNVAALRDKLFNGPNFQNPAEFGVSGFSEFYVLRNNPDVQHLVKNRTFGSAL